MDCCVCLLEPKCKEKEGAEVNEPADSSLQDNFIKLIKVERAYRTLGPEPVLASDRGQS